MPEPPGEGDDDDVEHFRDRLAQLGAPFGGLRGQSEVGDEYAEPSADQRRPHRQLPTDHGTAEGDHRSERGRQQKSEHRHRGLFGQMPGRVASADTQVGADLGRGQTEAGQHRHERAARGWPADHSARRRSAALRWTAGVALADGARRTPAPRSAGAGRRRRRSAPGRARRRYPAGRRGSSGACLVQADLGEAGDAQEPGGEDRPDHDEHQLPGKRVIRAQEPRLRMISRRPWPG